MSLRIFLGLGRKRKSRSTNPKYKKFLYYILNAEQCRADDKEHVAAHLIRTMFVFP